MCWGFAPYWGAPLPSKAAYYTIDSHLWKLIEIPAIGFQDYHYLVSLGLVVPKAFNALSK